MMAARKIKAGAKRVLLVYLPLVLFLGFVLFPFYWCINTAFKDNKDIISRTVSYFPPEPTVKNFVFAWENVGFDTYFVNSIIVSVSVLAIVLVIAVLTAYSVTRFRYRFRGAVLFGLLATQFLPASMMVIPLFMIFKSIGIINQLSSVILSTASFGMAFSTILMIGFMSRIPIELEEAAMIDGCNRLQCLVRIILPILLPGIVAVGSFTFINAWKEYLFTLMFINSPDKLTISVGLGSMLSEYSIEYGLLAAGCVIAMIPPIALFAFVQKYLIQGLASGAVKG